MASRASDVIDLDLTSHASSEPPALNIPTVFNRMMQNSSSPAPIQNVVQRDRCTRPTPTYTDLYNPFKAPHTSRDEKYSPYIAGEPLFDDRAVVALRLPRGYILAPPPTKPRTSWVWPLGYAITTTPRTGKGALYWLCKYCEFSTNSLLEANKL